MVVIIARDITVHKIKKKSAKNCEAARLDRILKENIPNCTPLLGRIDADFHKTIKTVQPNAIYLGYDQNISEASLQSEFPKIKIFRAIPYTPEFFKSSKF